MQPAGTGDFFWRCFLITNPVSPVAVGLLGVSTSSQLSFGAPWCSRDCSVPSCHIYGHKRFFVAFSYSCNSSRISFLTLATSVFSLPVSVNVFAAFQRTSLLSLLFSISFMPLTLDPSLLSLVSQGRASSPGRPPLLSSRDPVLRVPRSSARCALQAMMARFISLDPQVTKCATLPLASHAH